MFPRRCARRECFPVAAVGSTGKHFKMFPRWYGLNGETFYIMHLLHWKCFPVAAVGAVKNVSPSALQTSARSKMFPRRCHWVSS